MCVFVITSFFFISQLLNNLIGHALLLALPNLLMSFEIKIEPNGYVMGSMLMHEVLLLFKVIWWSGIEVTYKWQWMLIPTKLLWILVVRVTHEPPYDIHVVVRVTHELFCRVEEWRGLQLALVMLTRCTVVVSQRHNVYAHMQQITLSQICFETTLEAM